MTLTIRRAVPSDAEPACRLVHRSITELCVADHQDDESTIAAWLANKTLDNFVSWISSAQHVATVAEMAGAIAGFALLNRNGTVALLYVAPESRFQGVSKAMLAALEEHAASSDIIELTLESSATALPFYEACGYVRRGDTVPGFGVTRAYPLFKRLAP